MRLNRDNIDRFFEYNFHPDTRTIYIGDSTGADGVDELMAEGVIKALHLLSATQADQEKPIRIILNTFGGCWFNGMAIFDAIKACPCHVTVEVLGSAMSMGSVILQAADERIVHPNSTIMVHDGTEEIGPRSPKTFIAWAKNAKEVCQKMYEIYAERSGKSPHYWEKKCTHDYILTAKQAVEHGLADKVAGDEEDEK